MLLSWGCFFLTGGFTPFLRRGGRSRIRDVSGLLCALQAEGDRSLNAKLKSAGQKPFHWQTLQVGGLGEGGSL